MSRVSGIATNKVNVAEAREEQVAQRGPEQGDERNGLVSSGEMEAMEARGSYLEEEEAEEGGSKCV